MSSSIFTVHIAKVDSVLFDGGAEFLVVPAKEGEMTVLPHHMPFVTPLVAGRITVKTSEGEEKTFDIEEGMLEVSHNQATVLL